jgi:hypothetical protein
MVFIKAIIWLVKRLQKEWIMEARVILNFRNTQQYTEEGFRFFFCNYFINLTLASKGGNSKRKTVKFEI